ncbi:hypothetical protein [uncultured Nonlabens sp.]|uniref:hypothetical protein n=1 Tax=uncultured Nonlabens sp. TaxID=859306 RepID=UPI002606F592|nr:hypothetical protein [uncultured Nonlabens sp.]
MNFLKTLGILLLCAVVAIAVGFLLLHQGNDALGHKMIGLATLFIFLVIMPSFIWTRYKNKDLSKFNFHQNKSEEDEDWDINDKSRLN